MAAIEKGRKTRETSAVQKAQREEAMAILARECARAEFQDWEKRDAEFQFYQSKVRSEIRLREGRAKPTDILIKYLRGSHEYLDIEINEPYMVLKGLTIEELEELRDDIKMHVDHDRETQIHVEYWEALLVVCDWELAEAQKKGELDRARVRGEKEPAFAQQRGVHASVEADVENVLRGMTTCDELDALRVDIESQMRSGKVVELWEDVLKRLPLYRAKVSLKEIHAKMLFKDKELEDAYPIIKPGEEDSEDETFSPQLLCGDQTKKAIDPEEDMAILEREHMYVLKEQESAKEGDAIFGSSAESVVNLDSQVYWWHDKYRPRKPKYLNHVYTGYEWNKYNRTHYDHDNPPAKLVQGYKFDVFYSDLVDKTKAPSYTIEKDDSSNGEMCILRFNAGPPYEDLPFRIVNKEWECSRKKGFKCTFEHEILQLHFNFKHYAYRR